jgi:hypothetical protein
MLITFNGQDFLYATKGHTHLRKPFSRSTFLSTNLIQQVLLLFLDNRPHKQHLVEGNFQRQCRFLCIKTGKTLLHPLITTRTNIYFLEKSSYTNQILFSLPRLRRLFSLSLNSNKSVIIRSMCVTNQRSALSQIKGDLISILSRYANASRFLPG